MEIKTSRGHPVNNQVFAVVLVNIEFHLDSIDVPAYFVPISGYIQDYSSLVQLEVRDGDAS